MMCHYCGEDFADGDEAVEVRGELIHRDCLMTEQAIEATWQDEEI